MTFSHSENDTPSNLHARRAPMVVCPLGMHRITPFLIALPERTTLRKVRSGMHAFGRPVECEKGLVRVIDAHLRTQSRPTGVPEV